MKGIPELIAILALFPCGASMAMLIQSVSFQIVIGPRYVWIHIITMGAAVLTALIQTVPRFKYKRLKFLQFYCLLAAAVSHIIAGPLFQNLDIFGGYVFSGIAHGITMIATPSYLIYRCDAKYRTSAISSGIVVYLIGVAAMTSLLNKQFSSLASALQIFDMFLIPGIILTIAIVGLELAQRLTKICHYKNSLDPLVEQENQRELLFATKVEVARYHNPHAVVNASESNQWIHSVFLTYTRAGGVAIFSFALLVGIGQMVFIAVFMGYNIETLLWLTTGGAMASSILTMCVNSKWVFLTGTGCALILGVVTLITASSGTYEVAAYTGMFMYFFFGLLYPVTHSMVMETANFRYSEVLHVVGYLLEMIPLAIIQQNTNVSTLLHMSDIVGIAMCVWASSCIIIVGVSMPKQLKKSIITIRHEMWRVPFCNDTPLPQLSQVPPMYQHPQPPPPGYWAQQPQPQPQPGQQPYNVYTYQGQPESSHPQQHMPVQPPYNPDQQQNWAVAPGQHAHPADGYGWGNYPAGASGATGNVADIGPGMAVNASKQ